MDHFRDPCVGCEHPALVTPPCPHLNWQSPKLVLVAQVPGSGALCSRRVCRYNHLLKRDDGTALMVDWALSKLGVRDEDLLSLNALRCAPQATCIHVSGEKDEPRRHPREYARCAPSLAANLAPDRPKVILLAGKEAWLNFLNAFAGHVDAGRVAGLGWEGRAAFGASLVVRLAHPGRLGMNQRVARLRRTDPTAVTDTATVFLRDVEVALREFHGDAFRIDPGFPSPMAFAIERRARPPHPGCECRSHPGLRPRGMTSGTGAAA